MTIRHIVTWTLTATDPAERAQHADGIASRLQALVGVVPEIEALTVGPDVLGGANWHVALIADFADLPALARYQEHPAHMLAGTYIRSVVASRMAVDLQV
jgi:hypothetical protein